MADVKISEMIEAESIQSEDYIPIIQNGNNKKVKVKKITNLSTYITIKTTSEIKENTNYAIEKCVYIYYEGNKLIEGIHYNKIDEKTVKFLFDIPIGSMLEIYKEA